MEASDEERGTLSHDDRFAYTFAKRMLFYAFANNTFKYDKFGACDNGIVAGETHRIKENAMNLRSTRLSILLVGMFVVSTFVAVPIHAKGKNVTIDKKGQMTTIECTGNAVTVISEDNIITLKGECSKLTVKGKDNNITAATVTEVVASGTDINIIVANVGKINAMGNDINIVWANGIGGKTPKISLKKGSDINIVHTGK